MSQCNEQFQSSVMVSHKFTHQLKQIQHTFSASARFIQIQIDVAIVLLLGITLYHRSHPVADLLTRMSLSWLQDFPGCWSYTSSLQILRYIYSFSSVKLNVYYGEINKDEDHWFVYDQKL